MPIYARVSDRAIGRPIGINSDTPNVPRHDAPRGGLMLELYYFPIENIIDYLEEPPRYLHIVKPLGKSDIRVNPHIPPSDGPIPQFDVIDTIEVRDLTQLETWEWLVEQGVDVAHYRTTTLAAFHNCLDILKYLQAKGAPFEDDILFMACKMDSIDVADYLMLDMGLEAEDSADSCFGALAFTLLKERRQLKSSSLS